MSAFQAFIMGIVINLGWADRPPEVLATGLPPPEYWHEPEIEVVVHERWGVRMGFGQHVAMTPPLQRLLTGVCHVYINPYLRELAPLGYAAVYFHEVYGHCNGWPGNHPNKGLIEFDDLTEFFREFDLMRPVLDELGL